MGYKSLVCLNIGIIGGGRIAETLAKGFAKVGHNVFIGHKGNINAPCKTKFDNINYTTMEDAATVADIIVLTVPMDEVREVAYALGDVRRKVVVDATSFNITRNCNYVNTANVLKAITHCQHLVKCYNKTGYEVLVDEELIAEGVDIFMASDSKKSKEMLKLLAKDLCLGQCYDFGGNDTVPMLDEMATCWHNQSIKEQATNHILYKMPRR